MHSMIMENIVYKVQLLRVDAATTVTLTKKGVVQDFLEIPDCRIMNTKEFSPFHAGGQFFG